jgi:DNA polymerase III epsilon subunit-like protein
VPTQPVEKPETYISVDVETTGPTPGEYSMISIGACLVDDPQTSFYAEIKPVTDAVIESALAVSGLSMEKLTAEGLAPADAMRQFEDWIELVTPRGHAPIMVAFNAVFDWMFIDSYFHRFLKRNPFGHSALDIKAYYLGYAGGSWAGTSMRVLSPRYLGGQHLTHNALGDARDQAEIFRRVVAEATAQRQERR